MNSYKSPVSSLHSGSKQSSKNKTKDYKKISIEYWRFFLYSFISVTLSFLYINNGWSQLYPNQINIIGKTKIKNNVVLDASKLNFPISLFSIKPKTLEENLLKNLPVKSAGIRRYLIPPGLEIEIQERKAISYALRNSLKGKEKGMLDVDGYWIPIKIAEKAQPLKPNLQVEGWIPNHREWISKVLSKRNQLGSPLLKIILTPNGELKLSTEEFKIIYFGKNPNLVDEQLKVLAYLSENLPSEFRDKVGTIVDISDPNRPELQIPTK